MATITGGTGNDTLEGSSGNDLISGLDGNDSVNALGGDDTVSGGSGNDTLEGGTGNDILIAGAGDDSLVGGADDDTLRAGDGVDTLLGGDGNDRLESEAVTAGSIAQMIGGAGADTFVGSAAGYDMADYNDSGAAVQINLTDTLAESGGDAAGDSLIGMDQINGSQFGDSITLGNTGMQVQARGGNDTVIGGTGNDVLLGEAGDDLIQGNAGNDVLNGGADADIFNISRDDGTDTIIGGETGNDRDTLNFNDTLVAGLGVTVIWTGTEAGNYAFSGGATNGTFSQVEVVRGTEFGDAFVASSTTVGVEAFGAGGFDLMFGGSGNDTLDGGEGNDTLRGGAGGDSLTGGIGNDRLDYNTSDAAVNVNLGTNSASGGHATGDTISGFEGVLGSALNDTLTGSTGDDTLNGGSGNDTIDGGSGNDRLLGGAGNDTVFGRLGDDTLEGGDGDDSLSGGEGNNRLIGGAGNDTFVNGSGSDTISGGTGDDNMIGGFGNDLLQGDEGSDTFWLDHLTDTDTIIGGEGGTDRDLIRFQPSNAGVTVTFTGDEAGTYAVSGSPSSGTFTQIEAISGSNFNDTINAAASSAPVELSGELGDDSITGGTGNDTLNGGAGNDTLIAGDGDDSVFLGDGNDFSFAGTGNDRVFGGLGNDSIDGGDGDDSLYGQADNDSILGGTGNDFIEGNAGDDVIFGGDGNDTISGAHGTSNTLGQTGNDSLYGSGGNDEFRLTDDMGNGLIVGGETGETSGDVLSSAFATTDMTVVFTTLESGTISNGTNITMFSEIENYVFASGTDTMDLSGVTGPLTVTFTGNRAGTITDGTRTITFSGVDNLILTDQADVVDARSDTAGVQIDLGAGDDTFDGGGGDDLVRGGDGNDAIQTFAGNDTVFGGDGNDTIDDEYFAFTNGAGNDLFDGEGGDDIIHGGDGDDTIRGGTGNDLLAGEDGANLVEGGDGNDTLISYGYGSGDTLNGGADADTFDIRNFMTNATIAGGEAVTTGADQDIIDLSDLSGAVTVVYSGSEAGTITDGSSTLNFSEIENLTMTAGADSVDAGAASTGVNVDGGAGNDTLSGGTSADTLDGGAGDDSITGAGGDDLLTGGGGNDVFAFASATMGLPGSGNDTITDFQIADSDSDGRSDDQLNLAGMRNADGSPVRVFDVVVSDDGSNNAVLTFPSGETITFLGVTPAQMTMAQMQASGIPCFTRGTLIDTPGGARPVESLRAGDRVCLHDTGETVPVLWSGETRLAAGALRNDPKLRPVRIKPGGVFGNARPLIVSPQHCVQIIDGETGARVFLRARHLAEETRLAHVVRGDRPVSYHHILLPRHGVIVANGMACESFYPGPHAMAMLGAVARAQVLAAVPGLATGTVERAYGDTALPVIARHRVRALARKGKLGPPPDQPRRARAMAGAK